MNQHKVTLKKIAEYVGTSVNTVSLALRNSERISKQMRLRIQQLANELGYVPNYAAQALASNKSGIIGIYTHSLYDAVRVKLVDYLITELHTQNYKPMLALGKGHDGPWYTSSWMQSFQSLNVDVIVIIAEEYGRIPDWHTGKPTIFVACQPSGDLNCDYLALDRKEAAKMGVEHLASRGHKEILIACTKESIDFEMGAIDASESSLLKLNKYNVEDESDLEKLIDQIT
jgi:LacI family transcriptional regulator